MAQQVRSSWKRLAAGGIALAVAATPMFGWAQTQSDAPTQAQANMGVAVAAECTRHDAARAAAAFDIL